jgi:serine/threonine-protein kinase
MGSGGMGEVYRARDTRLNRSVAIKTIRGNESNDRARARLWREARAAASVRSSFVSSKRFERRRSDS